MALEQIPQERSQLGGAIQNEERRYEEMKAAIAELSQLEEVMKEKAQGELHDQFMAACEKLALVSDAWEGAREKVKRFSN